MGPKIAAQLGLVGELAATAHLNFFRLRLFLQSMKSVQGTRQDIGSQQHHGRFCHRLLHNFRGVPAFTPWIETDEGLLSL